MTDSANHLLSRGAYFYNRGMKTGANEDFRQAEEFYKQAAAAAKPCRQDTEIGEWPLFLDDEHKASIQALANLGYIYYYGRTAKADYTKAFSAFEEAAGFGHAESMYKLGDMLSKGLGCEKNQHRAFELYRKASELGEQASGEVWGSAAFRMAGCYENARGTELDFSLALKYYRIAEVGFEQAIAQGFSYYAKNLSNTRKAIKRIQQELGGGY